MAALAAIFLAACAHQPKQPPMVLPDAAEVGAYIGANWTWRFSLDLMPLASRPGLTVELVSVQHVRCHHGLGGAIAECAYGVTGRFSDGKEVTRELWSPFDRGADGALNEALIIWHERRP